MSINTVAHVKSRLLEIGANVPADDFESFADALEYLSGALMEAADLAETVNLTERLINAPEGVQGAMLPTADEVGTADPVMDMRAEALAAQIAANHLRSDLQPVGV